MSNYSKKAIKHFCIKILREREKQNHKEEAIQEGLMDNNKKIKIKSH